MYTGRASSSCSQSASFASKQSEEGEEKIERLGSLFAFPENDNRLGETASQRHASTTGWRGVSNASSLRVRNPPSYNAIPFQLLRNLARDAEMSSCGRAFNIYLNGKRGRRQNDVPHMSHCVQNESRLFTVSFEERGAVYCFLGSRAFLSTRALFSTVHQRAPWVSKSPGEAGGDFSGTHSSVNRRIVHEELQQCWTGLRGCASLRW